MAERKTLSKKIRFEVFKRDSFTCQYCGRMAPDVVLEVDHINAVFNGGENDIMNLVTSCFDCNRGKGKRKLSESSEIKKQQAQLKELNEKRSQLELMLKWKKELYDFEKEEVEKCAEQFTYLTDVGVTESGKNSIKKWISEFGTLEVLQCIEISVRQYFDDNNKATWPKTFSYIPRIANIRKKQKTDPLIADRNYIKYALRNKMSYINENILSQMLKQITDQECVEDVKELIYKSRNWGEFKQNFNDWGGGNY